MTSPAPLGLPKRDPRSPLLSYLRQQQVTDQELARILREAASDAGRLIEKLGQRNNIGSIIRSYQLQIAQQELKHQQVTLWSRIEDRITAGMLAAGQRAAEAESQLARDMLRRLGISSGTLLDSQIASARRSVESVISRGLNGISLSERVYKNSQLASGLLDRRINSGLALGKSAREIAADVRSLIRPDVRGGVSYAAMRLGRTELNNAFHTTTVTLAQGDPFVSGMRWNLSGSHPRPDICNDLAERVNFRGGDPGVYRKEDTPAKPHPQCLCFVTPESTYGSVDDFQTSYLRGDLNDYFEGLGYSRSDLPAPRSRSRR